jgi:hypothetical protein
VRNSNESTGFHPKALPQVQDRAPVGQGFRYL